MLCTCVLRCGSACACERSYHALVAVGQHHHQVALSDPLRLPAADELVDDALRGVREVAELRLPAHERVRVGDRVAELEACGCSGEIDGQRKRQFF